MRIGFLVWNRFQVGHFAELLKHFEEPDVIFIDRDTNGLAGFDPQWLTQYGAYSRFLSEVDLASLDGQYDAVLTQFTPPLQKPWQHTKLIMCQYSMAKPKTAYNARWFAADFGLVYGDYSDGIIGKMCPTALAGNSRFDPYFEGRLDPDTLDKIRSRLDPLKKTLAFLPTWGDLSSQAKFKEALDTLLPHYNVIYKPHHMTPLRDDKDAATLGVGAIDAEALASVLDVGPYIMQLSDVVVSDMSGIIFDALYCRKPVALLGLDQSFDDHKKADPTALEVAGAHRIGPVISDPALLLDAVNRLVADHPYKEVNEELVQEAFLQRGGCGAIGAEGIRSFLRGETPHHKISDYAAPNVRGSLLSKAYMAASKRSGEAKAKVRKDDFNKTLLAGRRSVTKRLWSRLPPNALLALANFSEKFGASGVESYFYYRAVEAGGSDTALAWLAEKKSRVAKSSIAASALARRRLLLSLQDQGDFFVVGLEVDNWASSAPEDARKALYNFSGAAGNIRFSRRRIQFLYAALLVYAREETTPPNIRRSILRDLGFLSDAVIQGAAAPDQSQDHLKDTVDFLGSMVEFVERAAYNSATAASERVVYTPEGEWRTALSVNGPIFEVSIALSFTRAIAEDDDGGRVSMINVTRYMIDALREDGWAVLPMIQSGYRGVATVSGRYPSATWHTTHAGIENQIHLKVGTFNSHIIIDDRGYSGWSSLAHKPLSAIVTAVSASEAEAQFRHLQEAYVESGRSKFKQLQDEPVPDVGPYLFFPMQLMTDTVAKLAHIDGLTLLEVLAAWVGNSPYKLVVKRHPKCNLVQVANALETEEQKGRIILSNAPIHSLIAGADAVVTVNSGAGAEALLHLKPVITTGDSDYAAATTLVKTKSDLIDALNRLPGLGVKEDDQKKFLWVYSKRYQVHRDDEEGAKARIRELVRRLPTS